MYHQHAGTARNRGDWSEVADNIEIECLIERGVPCIGGSGEKERVAVRRRFGDCFGGKRAAGARAILDDKLLAKVLRQPLGD
jgi:hypothetical protein